MESNNKNFPRCQEKNYPLYFIDLFIAFNLLFVKIFVRDTKLTSLPCSVKNGTDVRVIYAL
jgi:hypothetical protein